MREALLMRRKRRLLRVPAIVWHADVRREAHRAGARLGFMGPDHHRIRDYVVMELARSGRALGPRMISPALGIEASRVRAILDELEKGMTFLFRSDGERVDWGYPVTVEETDHRITLDSGDRFFGA